MVVEIVLLSNKNNWSVSKMSVDVMPKILPKASLIKECKVTTCDLQTSQLFRSCLLFTENFLEKLTSSIGDIDNEGYLALPKMKTGRGLKFLTLKNVFLRNFSYN